MRGVLVAIMLVGCTGVDQGPGDPGGGSGSGSGSGSGGGSGSGSAGEPWNPAACTGDPIALYGMTGSATPTVVGPVTIDATGVSFCLSLDARDNLVVAHFAAETKREATDASSFELALFAADGTLLREGWDVTFGSSPPSTFANLEYGVTKGQVLEAVLAVRAKTGTATSDVALHLFEPYE